MELTNEPKLKPHEFRDLVNDLSDLARRFYGHDCLKELIRRRLHESIGIK